jgi:hypothetical protein
MKSTVRFDAKGLSYIEKHRITTSLNSCIFLYGKARFRDKSDIDMVEE